MDLDGSREEETRYTGRATTRAPTITFGMRARVGRENASTRDVDGRSLVMMPDEPTWK
jgi:hypothetical protein